MHCDGGVDTMLDVSFPTALENQDLPQLWNPWSRCHINI